MDENGLSIYFSDGSGDRPNEFIRRPEDEGRGTGGKQKLIKALGPGLRQASFSYPPEGNFSIAAVSRLQDAGRPNKCSEGPDA